jgi:hypothetical protein
MREMNTPACDLVGEDHALPAPPAGEAPRVADEEHHDDDVHADERLREARARHRHDRRFQRRRDRLGLLLGLGLAARS